MKRMPRRYTALLLVVWMIGPFLITLLGDGMSGGKLTSLGALWQDLLVIEPAIFLRLMAWFVLLLPILLIWWLDRPPVLSGGRHG